MGRSSAGNKSRTGTRPRANWHNASRKFVEMHRARKSSRRTVELTRCGFGIRHAVEYEDGGWGYNRHLVHGSLIRTTNQMTATITVNGIELEVSSLKSFAFAYHTSDPGHPQYEELALLRVDDCRGGAMITKGSEAVVLKVLLASLGIPDVSDEWKSVPDPHTIPPLPTPAAPSIMAG